MKKIYPEYNKQYAKKKYLELKSLGHVTYTVKGLPEFIQKVKDFVHNERKEVK